MNKKNIQKKFSFLFLFLLLISKNSYAQITRFIFASDTHSVNPPYPNKVYRNQMLQKLCQKPMLFDHIKGSPATLGLEAITGEFKQISVGKNSSGETELWGINHQSQIYKRKHIDDLWQNKSIELTQISVSSDETAFGLDENNAIRFLGHNNQWTTRNNTNNLKQISVGNKTNIWGVNNNNYIFKKTILNNPINFGDKIVLMSHHSTYLVGESSGSANSNRLEIGGWETWEIISAEGKTGQVQYGDKIGLKSYHSTHLVAESDGNANADRAWLGSWETWEIINTENKTGPVSFTDQIALKSCHNTYLVAESDGNANANRTAIENWETWDILNEQVDSWIQMPGEFQQVSVGRDGTVYAVAPNYNVFKWDNNSWQQTVAIFKQVAVGNSQDIWGVTIDNTVYKKEGDTWISIPGTFESISVGNDGLVYGVNPAKEVYQYRDNAWLKITKSFNQVSVGNAYHIYGIDMDNQTFKRQEPWTLVYGSLKQVSVGCDGSIWGVNSNNQIYKRENDSWTLMPGNLEQISVGNCDHIWGVYNSKIYQWDITNNNWIEPNPGILLREVSVGSDGKVFALAHNNSLWERSDDLWFQPHPGYYFTQMCVGDNGLIVVVNGSRDAYRRNFSKPETGYWEKINQFPTSYATIDNQSNIYMLGTQSTINGHYLYKNKVDYSENIRAFIVPGDYTTGGQQENVDLYCQDWETPVYEALSQTGIGHRIFTGPGNHDQDSSTWYTHADALWHLIDKYGDYYYSFDLNDIHISCPGLYPSESGLIRGVWAPFIFGLKWLEEDLQKVTPGQPVIIFFHYPVAGSFSDWWKKSEKDAFYNIIQNYNVKLIVCGHTHGSKSSNWRDTYPFADVSGQQFALCSYDSDTDQVNVSFDGNQGPRTWDQMYVDLNEENKPEDV